MPQPIWRIELLGGLRAVRGDQVVTRFRTQKTAALLAYLAYHLDRAHSRDELAGLLWPDADVAAGRHSLSVALSSLRNQLEPPGVPVGSVVLAERASVRLNPAAVATDTGEFEATLRKARESADEELRLRLLQDALELYRGPLLPHLYEEWIYPEQTRLASLFSDALHQVTLALEERGDLPHALQYAQRAVSVDPLQEEAHAHVMRVYARMGRSAEALRQYRELERILQEELEELPSLELRRLAEEMARHAGDGAAVDRPLTSPVEAAGGAEPLVATPGAVTFLMADLPAQPSTPVSPLNRPTSGEAGADQIVETLREELTRFGGQELVTSAPFAARFERTADALAFAGAAHRIGGPAAGSSTLAGALRIALDTLERGAQRTSAAGEATRWNVDLLSDMLLAGHPGQILCSETAAALGRRSLRGLPEPGVRFHDLGVYRLRSSAPPERLFQVEFPGSSPVHFPPPNAEPDFAGNVPVWFTRFFARERELARLRELLAPRAVGESGECRLLTLTGTGGSGKTRLALETAGQLLQAYRGAVWFVSLAEVPDACLTPDALLEGLRVTRTPGVDPLDQAVLLLSRHPSLLILDNFEHLVGEGSALVRTLLERIPTLTVLVTSRQRLGLAGERELVVAPLPTPGQTEAAQAEPEQLTLYGSVQLFLDRAQAVRPDFQISRANAPAIAELCARLDGIPLAVELAAARVQALTPAQILAHLDGRLDFLASRHRDAAPRHRSLRAAIDGSYSALPPDLQRFFARLSIFRGTWSLAAASAICLEAPPRLPGAALDCLAELRDASLIVLREERDEVRFSMLETLRGYAAEQLSEEERAALQRRHAEYFHGFGQERISRLRTSEEGRALEDLEAELDNLRAAHEWTSSRLPELGAPLALVLGRYLQRRGFLRESEARLQAGLESLAGLPEPRPRLEAELLRERASLHLDQFRWAEARQAAEKARALVEGEGDPLLEGHTLNLLGLAARGEKAYPEAESSLRAALDRFRSTGDPVGEAIVCNNIGLVLYEDPEGSRADASRFWAEARRRSEQARYSRGQAEAVTNLGILAQSEGRLDEAWRSYQHALRLEREQEHRFGIARALCNLGEVAELRGDLERARPLLVASTHLFAEAGSPFRDYTADLARRVAPGQDDLSLPPPLRGAPLHSLIDWATGESGTSGSPSGGPAH